MKGGTLFVGVIPYLILSVNMCDSKLLLSRSYDTQKNIKLLSAVRDCITSNIFRRHQKNPLVFLDKELSNPIAEYLLRSAMDISVQITDERHVNTFPGQIFVLLPRRHGSGYPSYRSLLAKASYDSYFLIVWPMSTTNESAAKMHSSFQDLHNQVKAVSLLPTRSGKLRMLASGWDGTLRHLGSCPLVGDYPTRLDLSWMLAKKHDFNGYQMKCFDCNFNVELGKGNVHEKVFEMLKSVNNITLKFEDIFNETLGWFYYNDPVTSIDSKEVQEEESRLESFTFGIGRYLQRNTFYQGKWAREVLSGLDCISWAVQGGHYHSQTYFRFDVTDLFQRHVWFVLGTSMFIAVLFMVVAKRVEGRGAGVTELSMSIILSAFSQPTRLRSNLVSVKLFLLQWSIWGLVVACAYTAFLGSTFTLCTPSHPSTTKDLLVMDYRVAGGIRMRELLETVVRDDPELQPLLPPTDCLSLFQDIYEGNNKLAVLQPRGYTFDCAIKYAIKTNRSIYPNMILPCVNVAPPPPISFRKNSIFQLLIVDFLARIKEAGLVKYWRDCYERWILPRHEQADQAVDTPRPLTLLQIRGILIVYIVGVGLSVIVFIGEILYSKFTTRNDDTVLKEKDIIVRPYLP